MDVLKAAIAVLAAVTFAACGPGAPSVPPLPGAGTARLDPLYDVSATWPGLVIIVGGLPHTGLDLDFALTFDDASLRDGDDAFEAEARLISVRAGGGPMAYEAPPTMSVHGTWDGTRLATEPFGPIRVGNAGLLVSLEGERDTTGHIPGTAALFGFPDTGTFVAVKRRRILIAGTDFQSPAGQAAVLSVRYDRDIAIDEDVASVSGDPVARVEDGRPFIVNRFTYDNVQGLDPAGSFATLFEHSVGNLANPHDCVVPPPGAEGDAGLAFITRYGAGFNDVAVLDLSTGEIADRIDLAAYARNRDRLPRPDQAALHDGLIYVTLQDADARFEEFMNGRVVLVDPVLRQVVGVVDLPGQNPFESFFFAPSTGLFYVAMAGLFPRFNHPAELSGGIATLDPATRAAALLVDDDDLGGNINAVAVHSAARGYCVVSDASFHNYVKAFDPSTGAVLETLYDSPGQISTLETDGDGFLYVADDDYLQPRVLIFNAGTGAFLTALPVRTPPFSFAVLTRSLP